MVLPSALVPAAPASWPSDTVLRPRLLQRLEEGKRARLTLFSAPAGSGKTTLLDDWIAYHPHGVARIDLSAADNDPTCFWTRVITAIQSLDGTSCREMPASMAGDPTTQAARLAAAMRDVQTKRGGDMTLALDNFQVITSPIIHATLVALVECLPPAGYILIASRTDPAFPLARWRSLGQLTEVRGEDLQLTAAESREFLNDVMNLGLTHREVELLHARTEGWAAGLRLAAIALRGSNDHSRSCATFGGSHPFVFDYFLEEILSGLPEDVCSFLLQTSIVRSICAGLSEAITGRPHGQAMLRRLRRANLFLVPLDDQSRWYRYQRCFVEALSRHLRDEHPELVPDLHRRAMRWYAEHGFMREAVHHALAAGDFAAAADAIERQVDELLWERGDIAALLEWLTSMPSAVVRGRPRLLLAHAWALALTGQLQTIEEPLTLVEQTLQLPFGAKIPQMSAQLSQNTLGEIAAVRAIAAGLQFDTPRLVSWSTEAVTYAPESAFLQSVLALGRARAFDIGADIDHAMAAYTEARDLSERIANRHIMAVATSRLAELWALQGALHQAADTHRRVLELADEASDRRSAVGAMAHVGLGGLLHEWNDLSAAAYHFEEGMKRAALWGHLETLKGSYFGLARVKFATGAGNEALELLDQAEALARHSNAPRSVLWIRAMQARMNLAMGNSAAAIHWLQTSPLHPEHEPMRLFTGEYTTLVRIHTAQGEYDDALAILHELLQVATREHWMGLIIELLILQALVYQARGTVRSAFLPLRKALSLAAPEGYIRTFLDEGAPLAELLTRAASDSAMPSYLDVVLAAFRQGSAGRVAGLLSGAAGLTQREREILHHVAAGESNGEIAERLIVSLATVKRHISNIFDKLDVTSRTQAVARARQRGLL